MYIDIYVYIITYSVVCVRVFVCVLCFLCCSVYVYIRTHRERERYPPMCVDLFLRRTHDHMPEVHAGRRDARARVRLIDELDVVLEAHRIGQLQPGM